MASLVLSVGLVAAGLWIWPPRWALIPLGLLVAFAAIRKWQRRERGSTSDRAIGSVLAAGAMAALGTFLLWSGITGRMAPEGQGIALASPLPRGRGYCALSAGSNLVMNLHYVEGEKTAASFEKHSVDFVKVASDGTRTTPARRWHPKPLHPSDYAIFDAPVSAPCSGEVVETVNDRPDNLAGHRFRRLDGANRVTIRCEGVLVMLAHLKRGSVSVEIGDTLAVGEPIGVVGNSGNTEEPHLHIHAQTDEGDRASRPVVMLFDQRYIARGDCL
ncbi:M23 family metallopeptidase [Erythrobacter sp. NAP1]|uniref:M23 family metallopeptidase n=1 Tax=Erythrobacter sp. NAP1 TaxID=237727 RepID=UPI0012EA2DD9|nr:M23 family metallopeptidase [Erythrobacter sp. NAP1]